MKCMQLFINFKYYDNLVLNFRNITYKILLVLIVLFIIKTVILLLQILFINYQNVVLKLEKI